MVAQSTITAIPAVLKCVAGVQFVDERGFCRQVNAALADAGFDAWLESICRTHLAGAGERTSAALGGFFRLNVTAYLKEGGYIPRTNRDCDSNNGAIEFFGISSILAAHDEANPTSAVYRLPLEVHRKVFARALEIIAAAGLLDRPGAEVPENTSKRRAALVGLVHKETGQDCRG